MMGPSKTELYYAQAILLGMTICGARFGTLLQVILEPSPDRGTSEFADEEAILLLSPRWKLLSSNEFTANKNLPCDILSMEQQLCLLYTCANETIIDVDIVLERPVLILFLSNAMTMVIDGFDEQYESWTFGVMNGSKIVQVFALPGGQISCLDTYSQ